MDKLQLVMQERIREQNSPKKGFYLNEQQRPRSAVVTKLPLSKIQKEIKKSNVNDQLRKLNTCDQMKLLHNIKNRIDYEDTKK